MPLVHYMSQCLYRSRRQGLTTPLNSPSLFQSRNYIPIHMDSSFTSFWIPLPLDWPLANGELFLGIAKRLVNGSHNLVYLFSGHNQGR